MPVKLQREGELCWLLLAISSSVVPVVISLQALCSVHLASLNQW